ncbi:MAG: hypothetical protein ABWZ75_12655 [Novosphingobium sp.]
MGHTLDGDATLTASVLPSSAHACRVYVSPNFEDVSYADVVVIGRLENYRIIRDEAFRRQKLAIPDLSADMRKMYEDPKQGLLPDFARFGIQVEEFLVGHASGRLSVTWNNSTFREPDEMASGRYLIALRRPSSTNPPVRGPSPTIFPNPDPNALTLLQAPCSSAFIYEVESVEARIIRETLRAKQK